jgi:hypothetical protein
MGEDVRNLNTAVANLIQKGLPVQVQQALDIVRVVGNNAVHPGQIELADNPDVAYRLFGLVNLIADIIITQPKQIDEYYRQLPEDMRKAIEERDQS